MGSIVATGAPGAPLASSISLEKADHLLWLGRYAERAGGFFLRDVEPGERVRAGQTLGQVLDTGDAHVKEMLAAPVDGRVFFCHVAPLINHYTIAFKIVPETSWSHSQ